MIGAVHKLASLKITPVSILVLAVGVLVSYSNDTPHAAWIIVPLTVLTINLLCAILVTPRFRRDAGLLMFHICLLAVVALAMYGYLAQFQGRIEVAVGQQLQPDQVIAVTRGPLHAPALHHARFVQESLRVDYEAGLFRARTRSRVRLPNGEQREFGDNVPLHLGGYRFYTSSNKGYAALLRWTDTRDVDDVGVVNFPSFPFYDWNQTKAWTAPDGTPLELELDVGEKPPRDDAWSLDSHAAPALRLRVVIEGRRVRLHKGDRLRTRHGVLTYLGTRLWMGYTVYRFPLLSQLLSFALVGVMGLGWYYLVRFGATRALAERLRPAAGSRRASATSAPSSLRTGRHQQC